MEYRENCLCVAVLCTIIIVHKGTRSSYGLSTVSGFDLAWFSSCLPSASVSSVFVVLYISILKIFLLTSFSLPFSDTEPGRIGP